MRPRISKGPDVLNPATYLSGRINRYCTEKAINQFVLLLDRSQLPAMHRRHGERWSRCFPCSFPDTGFIARSRSGARFANRVKARKSRKGEERKSMPGDNFFPFPCLRAVKLKSSPTTKKPIMSLYSPSVTRSYAIKSR
ncbi:hypothetical protein X777_09568 [Ooceraea biroi]|uniref:Uncharacterized protein n=1 Tax=Ooceraea biroi TaxID=2015173 RepID=A0A026W834_OOCBI|nr:hypothetical protein X777_09568 [Ooceraea biroi]